MPQDEGRPSCSAVEITNLGLYKMGKYLSILSFVPPLFIGWYRDCARESSLLDSSAIIGFQVDVLLQPFNLRVSEAGLYIIIVCVCTTAY